MLTLFFQHCQTLARSVFRSRGSGNKRWQPQGLRTHFDHQTLWLNTMSPHVVAQVHPTDFTEHAHNSTRARSRTWSSNAQLRNGRLFGYLAGLTCTTRAAPNHRACARPGMQESRSATLTFCCCGHAEFGVCQHSVIGPDLTLCAGSCGEGPEAVPSRSGQERPVDSFHGCTRRDTFASGHVIGCCC